MEVNNSNMVIGIDDKPKKFSDLIIFALQHILAMIVSTITVPIVINSMVAEQGVNAHMPISATILASGLGTVCYILITRKRSPMYMGSSFPFMVPVASALMTGAVWAAGGCNYTAAVIGLILAALVYLLIGIVIHFCGTKWINKILPPIVVGPTIMVIGLSLAGSAINNVSKASGSGQTYNLIAILCAIVTLFVSAFCSAKAKGKIRLYPFIIGIGCGYALASIFSIFGYAFNNDYFKIVDWSPIVNNFTSGDWVQAFFNYKLFVPGSDESFLILRTDFIHFDWSQIGLIVLAFVPLSFVCFCEHLGDHMNLSNITGRNLLEDPGLENTIMGNAVAMLITGPGAGVNACTYGENVGVIATTKNASSRVVLTAGILAIIFALFTPISCFLQTIPHCVLGGTSIILYGFVACSGFQTLIKNKVDFGENKNVCIMSTILITGLGGFCLAALNDFSGAYESTKVIIELNSSGCAIVFGILMNLFLKDKKVKVVPEVVLNPEEQATEDATKEIEADKDIQENKKVSKKASQPKE